MKKTISIICFIIVLALSLFVLGGKTTDVAVSVISDMQQELTVPTEETTKIADDKTENTSESDVAFEQETQTQTGEASQTAEASQIAEDNENFISLISDSGYSRDAINGTQLVIVNSHSTTAGVYCFEKADSWKQIMYTESGYVGSNGVSSAHREGDRMTPTGMFPLDFAFGINSNPGTAMEYRNVTTDCYWVDDVNSKYYNQWVQNVTDADWSSAEHLSDYTTAYAYAVAIGYNRNPIVAGNGSAIFLHCGYNPTAGCIAVPTDSMISILQWLDPSTNPHILIY